MKKEGGKIYKSTHEVTALSHVDHPIITGDIGSQIKVAENSEELPEGV